MIYLNNQGFSSSDAYFILTEARNKTKTKEIVIRDVRVSKNFIELDISIKRENVQSVINLLNEIGGLNEIIKIKERSLKKEEALQKAIELFNNEKYWLSHEVLEGVWKRSSGLEKDLLNGLILIAAALVHDQKNEKEICISILDSATRKLCGIHGNYYEIDMDLIKNNIKKILIEMKIF
jgi:hypothetical protein